VSLKAILDAIQSSGQAQVGAIEASTQAQVDEMLTKARTEAHQLHKMASAGVLASASAERARILHQARLEALQIIGDVCETLVEASLCRIRECLADIRMDVIYPSVLRRLTKEALSELGNSVEEIEGARVEADPRDCALLKGILSEMGLQLPLSGDLSCWGGLVVKSADGRVVVVNTLESRLENATPYLRHYLTIQFTNTMPEEKCLITTMAMHACGP
jgi:vacuolar-type H+-ATPase subunit E/Vma4